MLATKIFLERELYNGVIYPESDGQPMADNTKQFDWIVTIKGNLDILYEAEPNVFVAGDLLWYPVEGHPEIRQAPDVMVSFGRPKGDRGSYMQFREGNIAPQVVFEILSPGNTPAEMTRKRAFYERYGVEEYYIYDPDHETLEGWLRRGEPLVQIQIMQNWISPRLGIRFNPSPTGLQIYQPDGSRFLTFVELEELRQQAQLRAIFAEDRAAQAEEERKLAEERAAQAEEEWKLAEERAARYAAKLRELGIDLD
ncbi:MAG: Uma2 family endonuclease [Caldilineaceae bacterium]